MKRYREPTAAPDRRQCNRRANDTLSFSNRCYFGVASVVVELPRAPYLYVARTRCNSLSRKGGLGQQRVAPAVVAETVLAPPTTGNSC